LVTPELAWFLKNQGYLSGYLGFIRISGGVDEAINSIAGFFHYFENKFHIRVK